MATMRETIDTLRNVADQMELEHDVLQSVHEYAQQFGGTPGGNVFLFLLEDALKLRGWSLKDFLDYRSWKTQRSQHLPTL